MFGFGFTKLAILVGIVFAVWQGFKFIGQMDRARKQDQGKRPQRRSGGGNAKSPEVEETVQCPTCSAYVVAKAASPCERPDCPY